METLSIHIVLCQWFAIDISCPRGPVDKKMCEIRFELAYVNYTGVKDVSSVSIVLKVLATIGIGWQHLAQLVDPRRRSVRQSPKIYERIRCASVIEAEKRQ